MSGESVQRASKTHILILLNINVVVFFLNQSRQNCEEQSFQLPKCITQTDEFITEYIRLHILLLHLSLMQSFLNK